MKVEVKLDLAKFASRCRRIPADMTPTIKKAIQRDGRFFVREILKITPPASGGTLAQGKKRGLAKVRRDVKRVFASASYAYSTITSPAARSAFWLLAKGRKRGRDFAAAEQILRVHSSNVKIRQAPIMEAVVPDWHQSARRKGVVPQVNIRGIVTNESNLKRYIQGQQKRVGMLIAGWGSAANKLGVNVPAWIKAWVSHGQITATSIRGVTKIIISNNNKHASDADMNRRARHVLNMVKRRRAMELFIVADIRARMRALNH